MGNTVSSSQTQIQISPEDYHLYQKFLHKTKQTATEENYADFLKRLQKIRAQRRRQNSQQNSQSQQQLKNYAINNRNGVPTLMQSSEQRQHVKNYKVQSRQYDRVGSISGYVPRLQTESTQRKSGTSRQFIDRFNVLRESRGMPRPDARLPHTQETQESNTVPPQSTPQVPQFKKSLNELTLEDCDPFNISKSSQTRPGLVQLKNKYKKLALMHHPDKGGSREKFDIVMNAYINLKRLIKYKQDTRGHRDLKRTFRTDQNELQPQTSVDMQNCTGDNFNRQKFNSLYEQTRFHNPYDVGYGDMMVKSGSEDRDALGVKNFLGKYSTSKFQESFAKKKKESVQKMRVVEYKNPKPVETHKLHYSELVQDGIKDFTDARRNQFTDYKRAHIDNYLIDADTVSQHKPFETPTSVNLKSLEEKRKNIQEFTPEERRQMEKDKEIEEMLNWEKREKLKQQDERIFKQYKRTHKLMLME